MINDKVSHNISMTMSSHVSRQAAVYHINSVYNKEV